jgi:hypothetical protein
MPHANRHFLPGQIYESAKRPFKVQWFNVQGQTVMRSGR